MIDWIGKHRALLWALVIGDLLLMVAVGMLMFVSSQALQSENAGAAIFELAASVPQQLTSTADTRSDPLVGKPAPDFTLKALDGRDVALADFHGRPVLINFWASWCPPCQLEMPDLVRTYADRSADGLVVLAVNLTTQDTITNVRDFVKAFNLPFPVLLDETDTVSRDLYRLRGIPMSVFVDRAGVVSRVRIGATTGEQLGAFIDEIVK